MVLKLGRCKPGAEALRHQSLIFKSSGIRTAIDPRYMLGKGTNRSGGQQNFRRILHVVSY